MNTEMKEESKNSEFTTKDREMSASLDTDKLKRMGFHYPELALQVIEAVERGDSLRAIAKIDASETGERGCINSYVTEDTERCGHQVLYVYLSDPELPFSFAEAWKKPNEHKADCLLFINRKWIQIASFTIQFDIVWQLDNMGKPLEEILECLKEEEAEETKKAEDDTPALASHDSEGEQIRIITEESSDEIEVNKAAACDDTAKAKDSDKEEVTEKRPNNWWTQPINDIEFTQEEFEKAKAKQATKSEAPCDLQCAVSFCKSIFEEKFGLYGASFCDMHPETVTDQLFMKATILKRQLTDRNKSMRLGFAFFEGLRDEFAAVVNYGVIALWQGGFGMQSLVPEAPIKFYTDQMQAALSLICDKSADYGELWRKQRIGTLADMIYTKIRRIKSIENQYRFGGMTEEGYHKFAGDQYKDLINYGLFGVVRMTEIADVLAFELEEGENEEEGEYEWYDSTK